MALTLPWLLAAAVSGLANAVAWPPGPPLVDRVVSRLVNDTAAHMAARRGVRLTRPLVVRLVDAAQLAAARAALSDDAEPDAAATSPDGRELSPRAVTVSGGADRLLRETLYGHLGWSFAAAPAAPELPDEVTGLYDLPHDRLLLGSWADLSTNRLPWMRDIAQALLARRFDLERWPQVPTVSGPPDGTGASLNTANTANTVNSDYLLARRAIPYGDATVQALEELDPQGNLPSPRALAGVVEALTSKLLAIDGAAGSTVSSLERRERLFLELRGLMFMAGLRARVPWTAIDEVWRRPPVSTEQLLHPEKYERGEKPDDVAARLPDQLHGRWRIIYRDTVGEWGIRAFLERAGNPYRAERAAAGWGGDRALLVRPGAADGAVDAAEGDGVSAASTFVAWITTWDDDTDAEDFAAEAALALGDLARVAVLDARPTSGRLRLTDADGRLFAVERRRRAVGLLLAAPANAENFLAGLLAGATAATPVTPGRRPARHPPPGDQARGRPR